MAYNNDNIIRDKFGRCMIEGRIREGGEHRRGWGGWGRVREDGGEWGRMGEGDGGWGRVGELIGGGGEELSVNKV